MALALPCWPMDVRRRGRLLADQAAKGSPAVAEQAGCHRPAARAPPLTRNESWQPLGSWPAWSSECSRRSPIPRAGHISMLADSTAKRVACPNIEPGPGRHLLGIGASGQIGGCGDKNAVRRRHGLRLHRHDAEYAAPRCRRQFFCGEVRGRSTGNFGNRYSAGTALSSAKSCCEARRKVTPCAPGTCIS
ncbi:MAG: hypothetical protein JWP04_2933 [Belnapia sp.]|nr:hypothetical protein [Belnapia sp.]